MSDHKKYLGKKREKIFTIEKINKKRTPKNLPKSNINLSINRSSSIKTKADYINNKSNSNLTVSIDKCSPKNKPHSLIEISKLVFEFLKMNENKNTTGNEVTEYIKNFLQTKKNEEFNQKNIQRRVYDSINVMCAAGLIKKENNKEIKFLKNKIKDKENNNLLKNENNNSKIELREENEELLKEKIKELEEKKKYLIKRYLTLKFYQKYHKLNETCNQRKFQKKLMFPFDLIIYDCSSPMKKVQNEDLTRILILSNNEFTHFSPYEIIKRLISPDILSKLNESNNNNNDNHLSKNKSNSKKSTNDESLLDDLNNKANQNNNINNEEREERKTDEDPKKIRILNDSYANFNSSISSKTKNNNKEKDDTLVYLKNVKAFRDELIFKESNQNESYDNHQNNDNIKTEIDNFPKENDNSFNGIRYRKNSNLTCVSYYYDENDMIKNNKDNYMSEIELFNLN